MSQSSLCMIFAVVVGKTVDHEHVPNSLLAQIMSVSFSLCPRKKQRILQQIQGRSKGNISGGARDRRRRELLGGFGGMLPQKILKSKGFEMLFPAFSKSYL